MHRDHLVGNRYFVTFFVFYTESVMLGPRIANRGYWLGSPANIKGANKDAKIYVERSTTLHNLLFSPHTLCMNYVINTFLLVSYSSVQSKKTIVFCAGPRPKNRTITYNKEL